MRFPHVPDSGQTQALTPMPFMSVLEKSSVDQLIITCQLSVIVAAMCQGQSHSFLKIQSVGQICILLYVTHIQKQE